MAFAGPKKLCCGSSREKSKKDSASKISYSTEFPPGSTATRPHALVQQIYRACSYCHASSSTVCFVWVTACPRTDRAERIDRDRTWTLPYEAREKENVIPYRETQIVTCTVPYSRAARTHPSFRDLETEW